MFGKLMRVPDAAMDTYYELLLGDEPDPGADAGGGRSAPSAGRWWTASTAPGAAEAAEQHFDRAPQGAPAARGGRGGRGLPRGLIADGTVHLPALVAEHFGMSRSEARRLLGRAGSGSTASRWAPSELDLEAERLDGGGPPGRAAPVPADPLR